MATTFTEAETLSNTPTQTATSTATPTLTASPTVTPSRAGVLGVTGDMGYYTYGMDDVNHRFLKGGGGNINGGLGYGVGLKLGLSNTLAAKVGIDYLFASTTSYKTIAGTTYNSEVNLPATMVFFGGEYAFLPMSALNLKLIAGYTLITIYNASGNSPEIGAVSGFGSGAQIGAGLELFLGRQFSLDIDLGYNIARIDGATFAGSSSVSSIGTVDYSGLVVKAGLTFYLIP